MRQPSTHVPALAWFVALTLSSSCSTAKTGEATRDLSEVTKHPDSTEEPHVEAPPCPATRECYSPTRMNYDNAKLEFIDTLWCPDGTKPFKYAIVLADFQLWEDEKAAGYEHIEVHVNQTTYMIEPHPHAIKGGNWRLLSTPEEVIWMAFTNARRRKGRGIVVQNPGVRQPAYNPVVVGMLCNSVGFEDNLDYVHHFASQIHVKGYDGNRVRESRRPAQLTVLNEEDETYTKYNVIIELR